MSAKYGQHFLTNRHAADRIVEALSLSSTQAVLEIGPGKGALTGRLIEKAARVVVVEVDEEMVQDLRSRWGSRPNLTIVHGDILSFDLDSAAAELSPASPFRVVGNLPYNLTSPILRRLSLWTCWDEATVMVQKEVGDRLTAAVGTGEYGALTVGVALGCRVERVFELSETSFNPPPKVRSSVVRLIRRSARLTEDEPTTQRVVQAAFQQRRKTILNSLSHGLSLEKPDVQKVLARVGIDENDRAERIPVESFVALTRNFRLNGLL